MFDTMTMTKAGGAFCGALLVFLLGNWVAETLYATEAGGHGEEHARGEDGKKCDRRFALRVLFSPRQARVHSLKSLVFEMMKPRARDPKTNEYPKKKKKKKKRSAQRTTPTPFARGRKKTDAKKRRRTLQSFVAPFKRSASNCKAILAPKRREREREKYFLE